MPSPTGPAPINAITPERSDIYVLHRGKLCLRNRYAPILHRKSLGARGFYFGQQLNELLFPLGLIMATFSFRQLRDVHGAEFWSAHGAELRFLVEVIGKI